MTTVLLRPRCHYLMMKSKIMLFGLSANASAQNQMPNSESTYYLIILAAIAFSFSIALFSLYRACKQKNQLSAQLERLNDSHSALLEKKYQWQTLEAELREQNLELNRRLNARTETVNRINHELTQALERQQQDEFLTTSLQTALDNAGSLILIIDKHYRVRFCSQAFLRYTGLHIADIQDKPLRQLEKHICLPEMASEGFTLNKQGWLDTQLKCRDTDNEMHVLNTRISLTWSAQKEIIHYVLVIDKETEKEPT